MSPNTKKGKKVLVKSVTQSSTANQTTLEQMRLIDLLKAQLKKAENEIQNLHSQFHSKSAMQPTNINNASDVHEKNAKLNYMNSRMKTLEDSLEAQKTSLERTRLLWEDATNKLAEEKKKNYEMQNQLRALELAASGAKEGQARISELDKEKRMLEAKLTDLLRNPVFQEISERTSNPNRLRVLFFQKLSQD